MKILLAPDSFKGSLSAQDFCTSFQKGAAKVRDDVTFDFLPVADGGEGTLQCLLSAMQGSIEKCTVKNSLYEDVEALVGFFENKKTAVIEAAYANGLPQIKGRENPEVTTTFGVGQMIDFAIEKGVEKIILTLGGSSTNDCGLGMLSALGAVFFNKENKPFVPAGGTLSDITKIDLTKLHDRIKNISFVGMCDVKNPLCGENGCSYIFAPQKGADPQMVKRLDSGCRHVAEIFSQNDDTYAQPSNSTKQKTDFSLAEGAGAAGGLGFAILAGLGGTLRSGIDMVLDLCNFDERIKDCDYIVTGEGSFDYQSLMGKVIGGIIDRVEKSQKKISVSVFCGKLGRIESKPQILSDIIEISKGQELSYAMTHAKENLETSAQTWLKNLPYHT
ncbi:MAG: glycerate kinase [Treponema sp.]|nr:glycerate kinase [Candidatus Treponema scatequi]